ncbi:MAG TPA: hypothetical protein PKB15_06285 [Acidimicrobiia bacterium]|nr:hypothetical protein [Acidimicrobiia bacterium]
MNVRLLTRKMTLGLTATFLTAAVLIPSMGFSLSAGTEAAGPGTGNVSLVVPFFDQPGRSANTQFLVPGSTSSQCVGYTTYRRDANIQESVLSFFAGESGAVNARRRMGECYSISMSVQYDDGLGFTPWRTHYAATNTRPITLTKPRTVVIKQILYRLCIKHTTSQEVVCTKVLRKKNNG